ncbi:MAG: serine/threonine protein kinase [Actinomycetota bacterium]|nr:serine/threonine protein kinase [Actinomycetota bacterium]
MLAEVEEDPRPGDRVGPYLLEDEIGRGSMGTVYRALRDDGSRVALKVLPAGLAEDETFRRRFEREGRIASSLAHPNVVEVLESGVADGRGFLATRLVEGLSLAQRLEGGPLPGPDVVRIVSEVAAALDVLHERGLVHRDVKPGNIMLNERGAAALTDFGLARSAADTVLTLPGRVSGTADYLAPELILGGAPSPRSDVYALGCVAYECIAGLPPFGGRSVAEAVVAHLQDEPAPVDSPLSAAVLQALAKDPEERPPTATAYALMLRVSVSVRGSRA